jgi:hypothetical protein
VAALPVLLWFAADPNFSRAAVSIAVNLPNFPFLLDVAGSVYARSLVKLHGKGGLEPLNGTRSALVLVKTAAAVIT